MMNTAERQLAFASPNRSNSRGLVTAAMTASYAALVGSAFVLSSSQRTAISDKPTVVQNLQRESIWNREFGEIPKGQIVYVPIKALDGRTEYMSLQFIDEGRATKLFVDGDECDETADGFPIKVDRIMYREKGVIDVEGRALFLLSGVSRWTQEGMEALRAGIKKDGLFHFKVHGIVEAKGLIQKVASAEPVESDGDSSAEGEEEQK